DCPVTVLSKGSGLSAHICGQCAKNSLQLEYRQARMFTQNLCHDSRDVRSSKTVARRRDPSAIQPGNSYINSERAEFNWRLRVVIEVIRILYFMRADRDDGGIYRRVTGHRQIIRRTHERYVPEVSKIRQFMQHREKLFLRRTQA